MLKLIWVFIIPSWSVFFDSNFCLDSECECLTEKTECCNTKTIEDFNHAKVYELLNRIILSNYFRFYKVNLNRECTFWEDQKKCVLKNCKVDNCKKEELPPAFQNNIDEEICSLQSISFQDVVDTGLTEQQLKIINKISSDDRSIDFVDIKDYLEDAEYVDLIKNPERFTGYAGSGSTKVWHSIFQENCLQLKSTIHKTVSEGDVFIDPETCAEFKVISRILSGFRTSVGIHLSSRYPIENKKFETIWGINYDQLFRRFAPENTNSQGSSWISDVYFAYSLVHRALLKFKPLLVNLDIQTGSAEEDKLTKQLLLTFLQNSPGTFNERIVFTDIKTTPELLDAIKVTFQNISRILDCVECEKCRLWGKVQIQGFATALKILFTPTNGLITRNISPVVKLNRMEIISLFNLFSRLSTSLNFLHLWRIHMEQTFTTSTTETSRVDL
ncbi:Ero1-like protein [Thelohanellus kitauei]|uniref:Ero1-like protein n=1 Tax=Thelohanellus kitauei TaxID=669202 RepID=A0A0C2NHC9_THEKT|nr:Ero1-like protein [Thelohanellus kitauei]